MTEKTHRKITVSGKKWQYALSQQFLALPLQTETRTGIQTLTVGNCLF